MYHIYVSIYYSLMFDTFLHDRLRSCVHFIHLYLHLLEIPLPALPALSIPTLFIVLMTFLDQLKYPCTS